MENDLNKNESLLRESIAKIQHILNKIKTEIAESIVDPLNLDEIRKILKVIGNINLVLH
jgi:hypothetical protein